MDKYDREIQFYKANPEKINASNYHRTALFGSLSRGVTCLSIKADPFEIKNDSSVSIHINDEPKELLSFKISIDPMIPDSIKKVRVGHLEHFANYQRESDRLFEKATSSFETRLNKL
ncbi:MAG: hypothetical protein HKN40_00365 [Winogradskyella sp.]|uniref:hypothetical protein n=1 Tax=Winogradskyella sp. TaxID=1883156 RepID=UPI00181DBD7C|nr:hypothetical protein [Winogradskyella sp.]